MPPSCGHATLLDCMHRTLVRAATIAAFGIGCARTTPGPGDASISPPTSLAHDQRRAERSRVVCNGPLPAGTPVCSPSSEFVDREDPCSIHEGHDCESRCGARCEACDATCRTTCGACFGACNDSACETRCASQEGACRVACSRERVGCASTRCAEEYRACRSKLVGDWLASDCRSLCIPYDRCIAATSTRASASATTCDERFLASAASKPACNLFACATLRWARERKVLDPSWTKNGCDDVCARIWTCAKAACFSSNCNEPIERYATCAKSTPKAAACDLIEISATLLCEEPPE